jgi:hypothetical protein
MRSAMRDSDEKADTESLDLAGRRAGCLAQKKRPGLFWKAIVARTALLRCAAIARDRKGSQKSGNLYRTQSAARSCQSIA